MTTFPSKLTKGESSAVKSLGFRFSPLYKSRHIISVPLPWSTNTLFTLYPPILSVTTKELLCRCMVLTLFSFEKLNVGRTSTLALFVLRLEFSAGGCAIDITPEGRELILLRVAKMALILPKGGLEEAFPWALNSIWSPYPLGRYKNYCNFPSLTSCSRWFHKVLQSSVVCPHSWWYW